ncbi:hypothetical protein HF313_16415 [Massilia atriviolacea]|uniref:Uncharacterized protein n=1 Tax=Massilia atriviolacea TaxID=2495579 RepID=A0A430HU69_9BURK|nr:hypothetical protein [Massilia atriviolacea]RSZ61106.1 hypothetical protein EJB06_02975 [Massilia atriviolacea]
MATQSISSLQAPLHLHSAAPLAAAKPAAEAGKAMGKADFDDLAGSGAVQAHLPKVRTPLMRRLARTPAAPQPAVHDDHDTPLKSAAAQLIESLSQRSDDRGEPWQGTEDPLQQQMLLEQARQHLEHLPDDGSGKREALGARLDAMQAGLTARHGPAIAQGKGHADALEGALAAQGAAPAALSALRQQFGAPVNGRRDAPMPPTALLDILLKQAGPAGAGTALGRPPAQLHEELRRRGRSGPRLWLSLQDAASFQLVNTSFAMAGDLRRELSDKAQAAPLAGQGELARLLLGLGDADAGQAGPLLRQLVDMEHLSPRQRGAACQVLRAAIARCPDSMWSGAAPSQRLGLLDQLQAMTIEHHAALPTLSAAPGDALQSRLREDHHNSRRP